MFSRRVSPNASGRYQNTKLTSEDLGDEKSAWTVEPVDTKYKFKTDRRVPKLGCVT